MIVLDREVNDAAAVAGVRRLPATGSTRITTCSGCFDRNAARPLCG
jgi:hypothetical protein